MYFHKGQNSYLENLPEASCLFYAYCIVLQVMWAYDASIIEAVSDSGYDYNFGVSHNVVWHALLVVICAVNFIFVKVMGWYVKHTKESLKYKENY